MFLWGNGGASPWDLFMRGKRHIGLGRAAQAVGCCEGAPEVPPDLKLYRGSWDLHGYGRIFISRSWLWSLMTGGHLGRVSQEWQVGEMTEPGSLEGKEWVLEGAQGRREPIQRFKNMSRKRVVRMRKMDVKWPNGRKRKEKQWERWRKEQIKKWGHKLILQYKESK